LVQPVLIAQQTAVSRRARVEGARSVVTLVGIQAGAAGAEEEAAMIFVRAGLRGDLNLRAAEASLLSVVVVGDHLDVADRLLGGRNDRGSAKHRGYGADAVDLNAVGLIAIPVGIRLRHVLRLEDAAATAAAPWPLASG
jgi:hypothetical protein